MTKTLILFPHQPFEPDIVDGEFIREYESARDTDFATGFYSHEAADSGDLQEALANLPRSDQSQPVILRGWMLPGDKYQSLYQALIGKGYQPYTAPTAYEEAHYLPFAYKHTKGHTARSAWIEGDDSDAAWELYQTFRDQDAIIKDWVKSAKSRWKEGCYLPANRTEEEFRQTYSVFREERSKLFNRGVVLREFLPIVERGSDIQGLPIIEENRLFFWKTKLIGVPQKESPSPLDELERWKMIADRFASPFITIDVARLVDGSWRIVEVGDGGVSGLPLTLDPQIFYANLWNRVHTEEHKF